MLIIAMKKEAHEVSLLEQKENATFRSQRLAAVPSDLLTMHNLLFIDLSHNNITRFPGDLIVQDIPRLEVLRLHHNLLYVLEDILALSIAPRLRELNVTGNPLRLIDNRIYFLEALLNASACDMKALRMVQTDPTLTAHALSLPAAASITPSVQYGRNSRPKQNKHSARTMTFVHKLPRRTGFPMLQKLNGLWIMDDEIRAVELERGRVVEYYRHPEGALAASHIVASERSGACSSFQHSTVSPERATPGLTSGRRFDGSRMTAKEFMKRSTRSAAIPPPTIIERFQIDVDSNGFLRDNEKRNLDNEHDSDEAATDENTEDSRDVIHRLFEKDVKRTRRPVELNASRNPEDERSAMEDWNHPIRSFDTLTSDDRQYIRHRSKQNVESNLQRDDHFFESSVYLDCVAQAERSRRLTIRAVDTLCPTNTSSKGLLASSHSTPLFHTHNLDTPISAAAIELRASLASKFTKALDDREYEKLETFLRKPPPQVAASVDDRDMQAALGEFFMTEHVEQRQHIRQLLEAHEYDVERGHPLDVVAAQLDDSLSKTKLRNAVDLANALLLNKKQEKRVMQMLIDADARAIEHERAALEQALHRHRLDLIASKTFYADEQTALQADRKWMAKAAKYTTPSPWQARNWRAKEVQRRLVAQQEINQREIESTAVGTMGCSGQVSGEGQSDLKAHTDTQPRRLNTLHSKAAPHRKIPRPLSCNPAPNKKRGAVAAKFPTTTTSSSRKDMRTSVTAQPTETCVKFRTIETVEQASRDPLDHVDSHDLLVRCAAIRQNTDAHTEALAQYRDKFLEDEAVWDAMRQDPVNIVRRHLRRKLYQDAQEIQIAGTQLFYSSLFQ